MPDHPFRDCPNLIPTIDNVRTLLPGSPCSVADNPEIMEWFPNGSRCSAGTPCFPGGLANTRVIATNTGSRKIARVPDTPSHHDRRVRTPYCAGGNSFHSECEARTGATSLQLQSDWMQTYEKDDRNPSWTHKASSMPRLINCISLSFEKVKTSPEKDLALDSIGAVGKMREAVIPKETAC